MGVEIKWNNFPILLKNLNYKAILRIFNYKAILRIKKSCHQKNEIILNFQIFFIKMAITFFLRYFLKNGSVRLSKITRGTFLAGFHNFSIKNLGGDFRANITFFPQESAVIRETSRYRAANLNITPTFC